MIIAVSILLLFIAISIGFYVYIEITYNKYKKYKLKSNLSGFEVARKIIDNYDLNNVYITESKTELISRYDSNRKVIRLTDKVFNDDTLISCAISSLEASHAVLDKKEDKMFKIKELLSPFIDILLIVGYVISLIGCFFGHINTIVIGLSIICLILLFHFVFYNIEKKSVKIAIIELINNKIISKNESRKIEELLKVTSYTSFASIVLPIIELVKKILVFGDSNR